MGHAAERREPVQIPDIAAGGRLPESHAGHLASEGVSGLARSAPASGGADHRRLVVLRQDARGVRARGRRAPQDLRHPVGPGHPERPALPGDRGQEPAARGGQPPQVRVPRQHVPRAADAAERDPRLLGGPGRADVRGGEREAGRVPPGHPVLGPASPLPDQRHPRPVQGGGRPARAGAGAVPSAHRPRQCPDPGSGAGDPARDHAHPDRGRAAWATSSRTSGR